MNVLIMDMGRDVRGECSLEGFGGMLELLSFSHGVAMQVSGDVGSDHRTDSRPIHQDLTVTRYLDAASPVLNQACCAGKTFPKVEIILGRNDGGRVAEYLRYALKGVILSSISVGGGGGDRPVEALTLNYNHITWKFTAQGPGSGGPGVVEGRWDVAANKAS